MRTASRSEKSERAVTDLIIKIDPIFHLSQTIWSSTKNLTALAMACLVDRGLLSYSDKYSQHQRQDLQEHPVIGNHALRHQSNHLICNKILLIFSQLQTFYPNNVISQGDKALARVWRPGGEGVDHGGRRDEARGGDAAVQPTA